MLRDIAREDSAEKVSTLYFFAQNTLMELVTRTSGVTTRMSNVASVVVLGSLSL